MDKIANLWVGHVLTTCSRVTAGSWDLLDLNADILRYASYVETYFTHTADLDREYHQFCDDRFRQKKF